MNRGLLRLLRGRIAGTGPLATSEAVHDGGSWAFFGRTRQSPPFPHNDPHQHQSRLSRLFPVFRPTRLIEAQGGTLGGMTWMALLAPKGTAHPTQCTMYRNVLGHRLWAAWCSVNRMAKGILQEHPTGPSPACITVT